MKKILTLKARQSIKRNQERRMIGTKQTNRFTSTFITMSGRGNSTPNLFFDKACKDYDRLKVLMVTQGNNMHCLDCLDVHQLDRYFNCIPNHKLDAFMATIKKVVLDYYNLEYNEDRAVVDIGEVAITGKQ
jgi:hypothetical protein